MAAKASEKIQKVLRHEIRSYAYIFIIMKETKSTIYVKILNVV